MLKSPLRYPGGKAKSAELILSYIPYFKEYREPFVGGGSVFLGLKEKYPDRKYWINDLYAYLYDFLNYARYHGKNLVENIRKIKDEYKDGRFLFEYLKENISNFNRADRAAAFFILNRITFSGTLLSGGYSESAFEKRFTDSSIDRLEPFIKVLSKNLKITNWDYSKVVNKEGKDVFIYLDPPYYTAEKSGLYGTKGELHKGFDHERFAETMKNCKHKWLITYDDCEYIHNLFKFANIHQFEATYGMKNVNKENISQKGKELIITNF